METRFHVPGFSFSAYLKSDYIETLHNEERIALAEMDAALSASVEVARGAIEDYFRERAAKRTRTGARGCGRRHGAARLRHKGSQDIRQ